MLPFNKVNNMVEAMVEASDLAYYNSINNVTHLKIDNWPLLNHAVLTDQRRLIALLIRKGCNPHWCGTRNFSNIHDPNSDHLTYDPLFLHSAKLFQFTFPTFTYDVCIS